MTALERAKAFINSQAARTALKIMPLALVTVAAVSVTPQAKADVALTPGNPYFQACVAAPPATCSGGFIIDSQTNLNKAQLPPNGTFTGAVGGGDMTGHFGPDYNGTLTPIDFFLPGTSTGLFSGISLDTVFLSWSFSINTPTDTSVDHVNVFFYYNGNIVGECDDVDYTGPTATCEVDGLLGDETAFGPLTSWEAQIQPILISTNGTMPTTWDVSYLAVDATPYTPAPPGMPEPASMILALSGLPLIGRIIRKKR